MIITKEFAFHASHFLPNYNGSCESLHGHTYRLHVSVKADIDLSNGIAYDFCEIKRIVKENVIKYLDHKHLNDLIAVPSTENLCVFIWGKLEKVLPVYEIKLWETPTSFITYRKYNEK